MRPKKRELNELPNTEIAKSATILGGSKHVKSVQRIKKVMLWESRSLIDYYQFCHFCVRNFMQIYNFMVLFSLPSIFIFIFVASHTPLGLITNRKRTPGSENNAEQEIFT